MAQKSTSLQFPSYFLPFPHTFPYVSLSDFPVSLGISHVFRGVQEWFQNWWLSGSKIPHSRNSLDVSPILLYFSSCSDYCFPSFFRYFPCFPWCSRVIPAIYEVAWKLVTKWLKNTLSRNSLHVSLHFAIFFLIFHLVFSKSLWVFSMFSVVFLPVSYFRSYA